MSTGAASADLGFLRPSRGRPLSALNRFIPGLRGRLLLAFIAISLFVVVAAAAGLYALGEVEQSLARTVTTVPVALDARELWRKSEKIIGVGPALVNASNTKAAEALSSRLRDELADTSTILARLRDTGLDLDPLDQIGDLMIQLNSNLDLMWVAWSDGIAAAEKRSGAISKALTAYRQLGNIWRPRFADLNTKIIVRLQGVMISAGARPEEQRAGLDQLDKARIALLALDQVQREAGNAFELINRAASASEPAEIDNLEAQAQQSIHAMNAHVSDFDADMSLEVSAPLRELGSAVIGDVSIFSWIRRTIEAKTDSQRLIAENEALAVRMKTAVDQLVGASRGEIASANTEAERGQVLGRNVLLAVAALSLVSSLLIVWLYVGRNIVARLTGLSGGMAAIAGGRRDVIVDTRGADEVSAMGRAVEVFRQNAIERDALLVERAEAAQRLEELVEERTKELHKTVSTLEETSEVIASSIRYASRIQRSILPESNLVHSTLSDYFILWEPRDVVSGDVYWLLRWGDGLLIVVGDCTGHGVPGAFVTLIANSALERALLDVDPGAIGPLISRMNQLIKSTLKQTERGGESDDGMDLGICYIAADQTRLTFAGAGISLFGAAPGDDLVETKGNKRGIGYRRVPFDQVYSETDLPLVPGMRFYMASDGVIDQIGGERHRAFGLTRLLNLLNHHRDQPMANQQDLLKGALSDYQGREIRRDDVLVFGFRLRGSLAASGISLD